MLISSVSRSYQLVARFSRSNRKANSIAEFDGNMTKHLGNLTTALEMARDNRFPGLNIVA